MQIPSRGNYTNRAKMQISVSNGKVIQNDCSIEWECNQIARLFKMFAVKHGNVIKW